MPGPDPQNQSGIGEEFYTDAHADFNASFEDALLLERFEVANAQLEDFKNKNGESALYLYRLARLKEKQKEFMRIQKEIYQIQHEYIDARLNKTKAMWNQLVAGASHFIDQNPNAQDKKNKEPYVKAFWKKHIEDLEGVAAAFRNILDFEPHDINAILGLIQCYGEMDKKLMSDKLF